MAKLLPKAIEVADIEEYLAGSDDFQLELHVFRSCKSAGLRATHGGTYKDPVTGINRQYDVRAHYHGKNLSLRLAVECKATRANCPLLVSRIPREQAEGQHFSLITFASYSTPRADIEPIRTYFKDGEQVGKSTAQIGRTESKPHSFLQNDSELFGKWTQAIASAHDLVQEALSDFKLDAGEPFASTTILPVLVVSDGTLWVADHDAEGVRLGEAKQVDECSLYLNASIPLFKDIGASFPVTHLLIFTKKGFDAFIQNFVTNEWFRDQLCGDPFDIRGIAEKKFGTIRS